MEKIKAIEDLAKRSDLPDISPGDQVVIYYKVKEGNRERIQPYQGNVIRISGAGSRRTVTVRKISYGIGVERIFPINSPQVDKIEVKRKGKVRRAKLYYLRERVGKATRIKEKREVILKSNPKKKQD